MELSQGEIKTDMCAMQEGEIPRALLLRNLITTFCRGEFQVKVSEANVDSGIKFERFGSALLESESTLISVPWNPFAEYHSDEFNVALHSFM